MPVHTTTIRGTGLFRRSCLRKSSGPHGERASAFSPDRHCSRNDRSPRAALRGPPGGRNNDAGPGAASRVETVEHVLSARRVGAWNADGKPRRQSRSSMDRLRLPRRRRIPRWRAPDGPVSSRESAALKMIAAPGSRPPGPATHPIPVRTFVPRGSGVPDQNFEWKGDANTYRREIAPARTHCLEKAMMSAGSFPHLTPEGHARHRARRQHAIDNQLRFPDEPVRHKMLDLIGDLAPGRAAHRRGHRAQIEPRPDARTLPPHRGRYTRTRAARRFRMITCAKSRSSRG